MIKRKTTYQHSYSRLQSIETFNLEKRFQKAEKILAVLKDYFGHRLSSITILDVGCSIGVAASAMGRRTKLVAGIDIDREAIRYAHHNMSAQNVYFLEGDSMCIPAADNAIDAVICSHVYEHIPEPENLMKEIFRVLKPGGACYFAAGNRFQLIEPHYRLPLLSLMPRGIANLMLRITGKGNYYFEKHLSLANLKKLTEDYICFDYTKKIIKDPVKYSATEMIVPGSGKQKIYIWLLGRFYWLCPTYLWVLKKPELDTRSENQS